jgi:subfamily B ATP-binding cassette protein MsbA
MRYRPLALIKRLLAEQGLVHWRKYAVAFVLMAVSAGCTAFSAYLIGNVINEAYVNHNLAGIVTLGFVTAALFATQSEQRGFL